MPVHLSSLTRTCTAVHGGGGVVGRMGSRRVAILLQPACDN